MKRQELEQLLGEIRRIREQVLIKQNDLTEDDFSLSTAYNYQWKWDSLRRVLLQFGNHMREHATHIQGTRFALGWQPTQPQRILAESEIAWGNLLASLIGLEDDDLDKTLPGGGWTVREILEHIRNAEAAYLEAIEKARSQSNE